MDRLPSLIHLIAISSLVLLLNSCSLRDTKSASGFYPQSWSADLLVERKSKSFKLKAEINWVAPEALRLDVLNSLDLPLAAIVLTDSKIEYVLYREKKYYVGKPGPHALDPVFPLTVDVKTLLSLLQERPEEPAACEKDSKGPTRCQGMAGNLPYSVSWSRRQSSGPLSGRSSRLMLEVPQRQVALKFYFTDWTKKSADSERLLALNVPGDFKTVSIPDPQ